MKKRLISIFMTVVMVLSLFQGTGVRVNASDPELPEISYIDASGEEQYIGGPEGSDYTVVESSPDSVTWESGWYVVSNEGDVHLPSGAIVDGEVHLILMDGAQLTASNEAGAGITVRGSGNSLTVYGQTEGAGLLSATGSYCNAGIDNGSDNPDEIGSITINGGTIEARGGQAGAGIGGGFFCHSGNITINGGTVTATGGDDDSGAAASGIGGGGGGSARNIYINGGSVTAIGGYDSGMADGDGAGIARGGCCDEEQIENIKVSTGLIIRQGGSADDTAVVENDGNDLKDTLTGRYVSINEPEYLTFTSESAFSVALTKDGDAPTVYLQYSTDKTDWNDWDLSAVSAEEKAGVGYVIYFRNGSDEEETYTTNAVLSGDCVFNTFTFSAESGEVPPIAASGNIMTLLDYKNPAVEMTDNNKYAFARLFYYCTSLSEAPLLPATTLADFCYFSMFVGCTSLTEAPSLPAEKMTDNCYNGMFAECTSLSEAPLLPATELADGCYCTMFYGCTSLTVAPELKAEALAPNCYWCMFTECPGLYVTEQDSAEGATWTIPVATGVDSPVDNMFTDTAAGGASVPTDLSSEHYYKVVPAYALKSDSSLTGQGGVTFKVNNTEGSPVAATTAAEGVTVTAVATEVTDYKATLTAVDEDGQSVSIAADGTFTMPAKAVTVKATYNSVVASVDFGGTTGVKKYSSLQDAINAASTGTETSPMTTAVKVTLLEDIIENISISKYQMIELDLSGHLLTGKGDHIVVSISGDLKISDSGNTVRYWMPDTTGLWKLQASRPESGEAGKDYFTTTGGVITGGTGWLSDSYSWGGGVYVYSNAKLTVGGGNIVGNTATYGGGLMNYYGTFTMEGGTISGNTSSYCGGGVENRGTFTMKGGTISTNSAPYGGGVCSDSGTFTMEDGTISGNTSTASGGGVYSGSTFTMKGGTISGNTAAYGGGVYNASTFTMKGGTVSGGEATYGGGMFNASTGTLTMEGGTIGGNTASEGGGVGNNGTLNLLGGEISANKGDASGGVAVWSTYYPVTVGGSLVIKDNTLSDGSTASNMCITSGAVINFATGDNAPTEDMNISVSPAPGTPAQNVFVKDQNDYSSYISIDDSGYTLVNEHDKLLLVSEDAEEVAKQNSTGELFYLLENAIAASSTGTAEASMTTAAKVTLVADTTENISIGSYQKIELDLNGHVLSGKGNYIVINISGDLKISDSGDTVRFWEPDSTGLWKLLASQPQSGEAGKDYFITTGGVITGGTGWYSGSSSYGGGAYVNSGAQLTLSGGNIVGNTATSGGGLYIYDGTFTMEGGIISGNTATYGSGVDVYSGTFTMKAGSIEGNTATYGGGVYNGGTFTMEGGTITGNKAFYGESSTYGGGVYNWTTFTFTGGTISDNTASYGGGVYHGRYGTDCTSADSVFTMSGTAKITGNTASVNGGGIATEEFGTLYLMGGEISANQAAESGGVQVYSSTHPVTVGGSIVITGNTDGDDDRASDLHLCYDYNTVSISTATPLTTGASIGVIRESGNIGAFTSNGTETDAQYFFPDNPAYRVTYVDTVGTEGGEGYVAAHLELAKFAINALSKTVESIDLADASMTDAQAIAIMTDDGTAHTDGIVVYAVSGGNYSYLEYVSSAWSKAGETKTLSELVEVTKVYVIGGITEKDLAEVDFGGITGTVKYKTVQAAIDAASADSEEAAKTVKLLTNVDVPATLTVASGKYVTLDLAGHVLSGKDITAPANEGDKASVIYNEGNLTIKDSAGTTNTRYWVPDATGLWQLQDSTPSGTEGTDYFTTTGGCITGGKGYQVASGGLSGGGVYNLGTFNLTGGNIVGNTAYFGGGVHNSGTLNLTGGNIVGNVAVYGGGVCNNGPLNLSGSNIVGNTATDSGGGVCNGMGAVMNFSSGSISGNHAIIGGGIVNNLNVLIMTGGSVTDNTITAASGTIYDSFGGAGIYQNGKMYIGGAAVIKNNKTNGVLDNLFCKKNTLTVAVDPDGNPIPSLASGAEIWINAGTSTGQITANGAAEDAQYFHSDNPAYRVKFVEATTDPEAAAHLELAKFDIATLTATVKGIDLADTAMTDTQAIAIMTDDGTDHSDGIVVYAVSGGNYSYLVYDSAWSKAASTMTLSELKQEDKVYIIGEITEKTELTLSATVADVNWTGEKVTDPTVTAKLDQTTKDDVSGYDFAYYDMENETSKLSENPSEAGYYKLVISIKDDDSNYYGTSETYYFLIKPVINNVDGESGITTGTDYVKNEQVNLELHSSADLKDFIKVMVTKPGAKEAELVPDNEGANYTVADGSIKVTLKKAYLDTLESGTYVFHIISGINTGTAQNPEWMKDVLQKTIEFSADITVEISDGCKYEACFAAGTNVTLLLGGKEAGKYTIAKVSNGYTIQDGTEYIALSADGKSIVRQAGSYTWKYDGGLYGEMKTTTTTKVLFWSRKSTKTTKVYLAMGTEDLTVSSKSAAAKLQVTGSHEWAYKDNNDGSTHKVYCSHCGKVKAEAEQHDYSYDETNHKCICGHVDPDFSGVKTVTVKETSKTSKTSGSHRFGRSSRTKTTYTYTISTTQVNVKVKTIAYSLLEGGKMQQIKNKQFTSDSKLSGFYIDVTDSNGVVTHWYYDGTKTTQLEEQSPQ